MASVIVNKDLKKIGLKKRFKTWPHLFLKNVGIKRI